MPIAQGEGKRYFWRSEMASFNLQRKQVLLHIILWAAYFGLFTFFSTDYLSLGSAILRASLVVGLSVLIFYFNTEVLIPRFLQEKRYWWYILAVVLLFVGAIFLFELIEAIHFDEIHDKFVEEHGPRHRKRPPRHETQTFVRRGFRMVRMFSVLAVLFISTAYKTAQLAARRAREAALLKAENLETEMKLLKSQVNPHFLFNALNNIYSLSVIKSDKAPEVVLKLSDLLRYNLYETDAAKVRLEKEIAYLKDYIQLQQLKTEESQQIQFEVLNQEPEAMIEPMLFIPFMENCFKHGNVEDVENGWVKIKLSNTAQELNLEVENSIPKEQYTKDKVGGIGLDNVRRRLNLLYEGRHELKVERLESSFKVVLKITWS